MMADRRAFQVLPVGCHAGDPLFALTTRASTSSTARRAFQRVPTLDDGRLVYPMKRRHLIVGDSGGIQGEAPTQGMPIRVLRVTTRAPEGAAGTQPRRILAGAGRLVYQPGALRQMAIGGNAHGDDHAAAHIVEARLR